jgi:hypothetical protein
MNRPNDKLAKLVTLGGDLTASGVSAVDRQAVWDRIETLSASLRPPSSDDRFERDCAAVFPHLLAILRDFHKSPMNDGLLALARANLEFVTRCIDGKRFNA